MGRSVRPAQIEQLDAKTFSIILTQGLNRQIRRMCHKIENEVISLKRIRISTIELLDLKPGEYRVLDRDEFGD